MSMRYPGPREFGDGAYVRTPTGKVGRVVESRVEREPQHDEWWWCDKTHEWYLGDGDEYMQHVYVVEFVTAADEVETWPWPEDLLEVSSPMDALVQH